MSPTVHMLRFIVKSNIALFVLCINSGVSIPIPGSRYLLQTGQTIADSDCQDEQTLMKHLFACIRAGQVAIAQELCVKMGEPWRAASIEDWKLYHDPNAGWSKEKSRMSIR